MSDPHQRRPFQGEARRLAARTLAEWEETEGDDLASSGESLDRLELRISHALEEIAESAAAALQSEQTAATDKVRRQLINVLKPFAEAAENLDDKTEDRSEIWELPAAMSITAGDLRRAARALTPQNPGDAEAQEG